MKNKKAKQMICSTYFEKNSGKVEFCRIDSKGLYAWHYPPCEGGWYVRQGTVSLTNSNLESKALRISDLVKTLRVNKEEFLKGITDGK